jgi:bifunctional DNase/RNase
MEVEMKIRGLLMDPVTNMPIVILKDAGSDTVLPIWVGIYEANAIALEIEKVSTPRPMTHDLIKNVLTGLETQVHKVVVTELKEDTFFAVIWLERNGHVISIDSRPSDALALALRVDCPIFVEDEVLKNSKQATTASDRVTSEELRKWLEGLNDEDLGRYKMLPRAVAHPRLFDHQQYNLLTGCVQHQRVKDVPASNEPNIAAREYRAAFKII